jgi:lipoate-protein ligase A
VSAVWRLLVDDGADAAGGLALDEALMATYHRGQSEQPPTLRLYTYADHCALVGRYQHLAAEVDLDACAELGVAVNRRPTGGGAIIMGAGQLGVAFVTAAPAAERPRQLLERCSAGIVAGLAKIGLTATFRGKNDLQIDGRKVAGLGLYLDGSGGLLFHASVLADLDVPTMLRVLRIPAARLGEAAVAAVHQRITTVSRETREPWDGARLRQVVQLGFTEALGVDLRPGMPSADETRHADALRRDRYDDDAWRMRNTPQPDATATATLRTPGGLLRVYLALQGDVIKSALFTGDVNELPCELTDLEAALKWQRLDPETLGATLDAFYRATPVPDLPAETVAGALLEAGTRATSHEVRAVPYRQGSCYFPEET